MNFLEVYVYASALRGIDERFTLYHHFLFKLIPNVQLRVLIFINDYIVEQQKKKRLCQNL